MNYTIQSWQKVANRNPNQTALFRYKGKWREVWGGPGMDQVNPENKSLEMKHIFGGNSLTSSVEANNPNLIGWKASNAKIVTGVGGAPICSIFSGTVSEVKLISSEIKLQNRDKNTVYGWSVTIKAITGETLYYANIVKLLDGIKVGTKVNIGEVIGYLDASETDLYVAIGEDNYVNAGKSLTSYLDDNGYIKNSGSDPISNPIPVNSNSTLKIITPEVKLIDPNDFIRNKQVLRLGDQGESVERLQNSLINSGYDLPQFGVDSKFGEETLKKVREFQRARGISVDGEVGEETAAALSGKEIRKINRAADALSGQRKFKIYDSERKKILIAHVESANVIEITTRIGKRLGEARIVDGFIVINYTIDGQNITLKAENSNNSVYRGIYNIYNRFRNTIISGESPVQIKDRLPQEEENKIEQEQAKIEEPVSTSDEEIKDAEEEVKKVSILHNYTDPKKSVNIQILLNEMEKQGVTNPFSKIGILSVIGKESGFIPRNENMNYSKERLPEVWSRFSKTGERVKKGQGKYNYNDLAVEYAHNPEKLANFVYGGKFHNNNSGDGWKYRGRGFNGITFKAGYEKYSRLTGIDLVSNPDQINNVQTAAKIAIIYFINTVKIFSGREINSFTSQHEATYLLTKANAGGSEVAGTETYANAQKVEKNFSVA